MSIEDIEVYRIYKCEECKAEISYKQKSCEEFKKKCPFCNKNCLYMDRGIVDISILIDPAVPKTFGAQSDINIRQAEKEGTLPPPKKTPFWRKNKKKIDYNILKNPSKYVVEGRV